MTPEELEADLRHNDGYRDPMEEPILWVAVTERMPENGEEVLVRTAEGTWIGKHIQWHRDKWHDNAEFDGWYDVRFSCWDCDRSWKDKSPTTDWPLEGVTHWAAMPKGPQT